MFSKLKQLVPSQTCLACEGCCRFSAEKSCWRPRVTADEQRLAAPPREQREVFSSQVIGPDHAIRTIPWKDLHLCYFFNTDHHTCGIYSCRPFECQLYPFILVKKPQHFELGVHLACPYVQESRQTAVFVEYLVELKTFFAQKSVQRFLPGYRAVCYDYAGLEQEIEMLFVVEESSSI